MFDANITLNQLTENHHGISRLKLMVGAKHFNQSKDEQYVSFRFMRGASNKSNYMKITLTADDLYDVTFGYIRGMKYTVRETFQGVYFDSLKGLFEDQTKLYLSI